MEALGRGEVRAFPSFNDQQKRAWIPKTYPIPRAPFHDRIPLGLERRAFGSELESQATGRKQNCDRSRDA